MFGGQYAIMDPAGQTVGYIAEEEAGIVSALSQSIYSLPS